jgi:hypothetical protein
VSAKQAAELVRLRGALEQIVRYKHTPRAYRHMKFEALIQIAQEALDVSSLLDRQAHTDNSES